MNRVRKGFTATALSAAVLGAYFFGGNVIKDVQFARAQEQVQASREQLQTFQDFAGVYRAVGKAVEPSVVSIRVHKFVKGVKHAQMPFDDDMLKRFFPDQDGDGQPDVPDNLRNRLNGGDDTDMEQVGTGSGVIIQVDGSTAYIVTNNHVAGGADEMTITLSDGRQITKAKTIGTDPKSDLAVVKIEADRLIPAKWGDSDDLSKGDIVMAFGSPFGYVGSMTHGIVSGLNRTSDPEGGWGILGKNGYENFIQVDAPINPGNSGGPLVNLKGEVVGINTAIASRTGSFNGIGFAIPSDQARNIYQQLRDKGKVTRGFLGVKISDVAHDLPKAQSFGYHGTTGALVEETYEDTPATGKLETGDIVTAINGKPIQNNQALRNVVAATKPGEDLKFTVFRDGKSKDVSIKLGEQPDDLDAIGKAHPKFTSNDKNGGGSESADTRSPASFGVKLATPTPEQLKRFGLSDVTDGALVTAVEPRSPAAKAGLQPGDVITKVGRQEVTSADDARTAISKQDVAKGIRFYVTNREGSRFVFVQTDKSE